MPEPADLAALHALLAPAAARFGVALGGVLGPLARYAALLLAWNERMNLTGARDLETLAREHLADAFAIVPFLPSTGRCLDVGSGAGLPGVVLAIARPDLRFDLLEPLEKRRAFLSAVKREAGLGNVSVLAGRLEDVAPEGAAYDFAVARAVLALSEWMRRGADLVRPGGAVIGLGGGDTPPIAGTERHPYDAGAGPRTLFLLRR